MNFRRPLLVAATAVTTGQPFATQTGKGRKNFAVYGYTNPATTCTATVVIDVSAAGVVWTPALQFDVVLTGGTPISGGSQDNDYIDNPWTFVRARLTNLTTPTNGAVVWCDLLE